VNKTSFGPHHRRSNEITPPSSFVRNAAHEPALGLVRRPIHQSPSLKERDMTENDDQVSSLRAETQQAPTGSETTTTLLPSEHSQSKSMKYYDLKNWHRVKPHLGDKKLNDILVRDFNKFTFGRWGQTFTHGDLPSEFETNDWDCNRRGRRPAFWNYVKHSACHWLVNFTLRLAMLTQPKRPWIAKTLNRLGW
jgi:hypothetical protein